MMNIEDSILYEDQDILVCRKPSGFPVQSKRIGTLDMESALKTYRVKKKEAPYIGVIHRLDQPVQGIVVFAKNQESAAHLSRQIQEGKMEKIYLACVEGTPEKKQDMLIHEIEKDSKKNTARIVEKKTKNSKRAVLSYQVLKQEQGKSWLEIHLQTGRHHQIRVQLAHVGMPIVGDRKYNKKFESNSINRDGVQRAYDEKYYGKSAYQETVSELALCAYKLSFIHPKTKKKMEFQAEPVGKFPTV